MGLLSTIGPLLGTCAAGVITTLAAAEFSACAPSWARRIVRRAARRMPKEEIPAAEEEWLAHIEDIPGNISKVLHACGLWNMVLFRNISKDLLIAREILNSYTDSVILYGYIVNILVDVIIFTWNLLHVGDGSRILTYFLEYAPPLVITASLIRVSQIVRRRRRDKKLSAILHKN